MAYSNSRCRRPPGQPAARAKRRAGEKVQQRGVPPQSIADTYAEHGLLTVLPCYIRHKMESFGAITRKDRPLSEAARFFLSALHQRGPSSQGASRF